MEPALPRDGDGPTLARVKKRLKDSDGEPIGVAHHNPIWENIRSRVPGWVHGFNDSKHYR